MRGTLLGIVVVLLAATPASAVIQYNFRNRQVATGTSPGSVSDLEDTDATGPWTGIASSGYSDDGGFASASATQVSNLGDFEISMSGAVGGAGAGNTPPNFGGYFGTGQSVLNASFTLDSDSRYVSTLVSTAGVMSFNFSGSTASYDANSSGVLPAGFYGLSIVFQDGNSGVGPGAQGGEYAYNLTIVPEPSSVCLILAGALLAAGKARRNRRR